MKLKEWGGVLSGWTLVLFGAASIVVGVLGLQEVRDTISREKITATADVKELGVDLEPGQLIKTGEEAKQFAQIIRLHALESTGQKTYAEMGRYLTASGDETNVEAQAAKDQKGRPVDNAKRNIWVTATALTTALNTAFMAERIAIFAVVMGVALLLTGIGFLVLVSGGALRARRR